MAVKRIEGKDIEGHLRDMLARAQSEISIASAWVKGSLLKSLLRDPLQRGVRVRLVVRAHDKTDFNITDPDVFDIPGVEYAYHQSLHAKLVVVDGREAMVGSANITYSGVKPDVGNREVVMFVDGDDAKAVAEQFETIWQEAFKYGDGGDVVGFVMNPSRPYSVEIVLMDSPNTLPVGSLLEVDGTDGDKVILQITSEMTYNTDVFMNPFSAEHSQLFPDPRDFVFINDATKPKPWRIGAFLAYISPDKNFHIATAKVLGRWDGSRLDTVLSPPPVGVPVRRLSVDMKSLLNSASQDAGPMGLEVGKVFGSDTPVFLDVDGLIRRHMAVLGVTGSGKSYFVKEIVLPEMLRLEDVGIVVFDMHGEYAQRFEGADGVLVLDVADVVQGFVYPYPCSEENVKKVLEPFGIPLGGNDLLGKRIKKDYYAARMDSVDFRDFAGKVAEKFKELLKDYENGEGDKKFLDKVETNLYGIKAVIRAWENIARWAEEIYRAVERLTSGEVKMLILNMSGAWPEVRVGVAASVVDMVFGSAKGGDGRYVIVLEEAHNFVPEKSAHTDVGASKTENPAMTSLFRVAAEGRKFGVGLWVITQRPASLNKYILAQMGTYVIFRLVNKNDLNAVEGAVEYAGSDIMAILPSLMTGQGVVSGISVPFPLIVDMRRSSP